MTTMAAASSSACGPQCGADGELKGRKLVDQLLGRIQKTGTLGPRGALGHLDLRHRGLVRAGGSGAAQQGRLDHQGGKSRR